MTFYVKSSRQRYASGFTLVEMMVASLILGIILAGIQSSMILASHCLPSSTSTDARAMQAALATDQLTADLGSAISINTMDGKTIEMVVPDRDGDGASETIRYAWSGNSGDPLLRTYDGRSGSTVVGNVTQFALTFRKVATKQATSFTESAEQLLFSSAGGTSSTDVTINANAGLGQAFTPVTSSGAAYWRVTRATFNARGSSLLSSPELRVCLFSTAANKPLAVCDFDKITPLSLGVAYGSVEADFSGSATFSPGATVCIAMFHSNGGNDYIVQSQTNSTLVKAARVLSSDGGSSWTIDTTKAVPMNVYGVVGTQNADAYQYNLTCVGMLLKAGSAATPQVQVDLPVPNQPIVSGP